MQQEVDPYRARWPYGEGETAALICSHDWSKTPLGPITSWPERLRAAVDTALATAFATFVWWGEDLTQIYNDASLPILLAKHPQALGQPAREAWSDAWPAIGPLIEHVLATGDPVRREDLPVALDRGGHRDEAYFTFCYSALRDAGGQVAGIAITAIETTSRVRTEVALRDTEAQFRGLLENSATISWLKDEEGRYVYLSRSYQQKFGVRLEDWKGKSDFDVWPPDIAEAFRRNDLAVLAANRAFEVEELATMPDGSSTWWLNHKFVFRDSSGSRYVGGMGVEITERKNAEAALRDSEAQFRGLLENSATASWVKDEDGRYVYISRNYEKYFGVRLEDWKGKTDHDVWPQDVADELRRNDLAVLASNQSIEVEESASTPEGTKTWWLSHKFVFHDASGKRFVGGIGVDITDRKRAEAALAKINQELEQRVAERTHQLEEEMRRRAETLAALAQAQRMEAIGQLAGGVAHDINNLLTIVSGNLEFALARIDDSETRLSIRQGLDAVQSGAGINRRLLSFARQRTLEPVRLDLNERVVQTADLLQRSIGEQIALATRLAADLWTAEADPAEVENALLNLALNARDAMPTGGTLSIETRNVALDTETAAGIPDAWAGDYVVLRVADTGYGMTAEVRSRAIEPFFTTKGPGKGTGLGLSSVYGFARQSGGFLSISSAPGKGTAVDIFLPRAAPEAAMRQGSSVKGDVPRGDGELVLVVEDNDDVRGVTRRRLEGLGYAVLEAANGRQAIDILRSGTPVALVFSDIAMPGELSGTDVARLVNAMTGAPKLLLTSGDGGQHSSTGLTARGFDVLWKPYDREQLAFAVRQALDTCSASDRSTRSAST